MKLFNLSYKNDAIKNSTTDDNDQIAKAEYMLRTSDENMLSTARACLVEWIDESHENIELAVNKRKSLEGKSGDDSKTKFQ